MGKVTLSKNKKFIPTRSNPGSINLRKKAPTLLVQKKKPTIISNRRRQRIQLKKQKKLNAVVKEEYPAPFVNTVKIEIDDVLQDRDIVSHYHIDDSNSDVVEISNEKSMEETVEQLQEEVRLAYCTIVVQQILNNFFLSNSYKN